MPDGHVESLVATIRCNWLQPLETLWDPYHVSWLHQGTIEKANAGTGNDNFFANGLPETEYQPADYGFRYLSRSPDGLVLGVPFVMPWYSHHMLAPEADGDRIALGHVPVDDENTLIWAIIYNPHRPLDADGPGMRMIDSFPSRHDYRSDYTQANAWRQDRSKMASGESFSGLGAGLGTFGVFIEDYGAAESMGPIVDRNREHLGATDAVIIQARAMLLETLRSVEAGGAAPGSGPEAAEAAPTIAHSA